MNSAELRTGTIEYEDSGGDGAPVVLLHGLLMNSSLWERTLEHLPPENRYIRPTLPMGAHRTAVRAEADLSLRALAAMASEFIESLDLHHVTLVGVDTGGALVQLVLASGDHRVTRAVLISCEAFDNLPPGATGKTLALASRLSPRGLGLFMQQLRLRPVRRLPMAFGSLTKHGDAECLGWIQPLLTRPETRRDTIRLLRAVFADRSVLLAAAERLHTVSHPTLVLWAKNDRVMPPAHGRRLAELLPRGRFVEIEDTRTLVPVDQPKVFAEVMADFFATSQTHRE